MYSYTTHNADIGQSHEINGPVAHKPELSGSYMSPEAAKLKQAGDVIDWLRQAAVLTGNYDLTTVNKLVPADNKSIVGYLNHVIFGGSQAVSAYDRTKQLLQAEAKLGGEFFGGDNASSNHQFFSFTPDKWVYYERKSVGFIKSEENMINYEIFGGSIRKSVDGRICTMSQMEMDNLTSVVDVYANYIGAKLYPDLYKRLRTWQAKTSVYLGSASVGAEAKTPGASIADQGSQARSRLRNPDYIEPSDFSWAA